MKIPEPETEAGNCSEGDASPPGMVEIEECMSTAVLVDVKDYSSEGASVSESDDEMDKLIPEGNEQVEPEEAPEINPSETDVPTPEFYGGELDMISMTASESDYVRKFSRKFENLRKSFTRIDVSKVTNDFAVTRKGKLKPPPM